MGRAAETSRADLILRLRHSRSRHDGAGRRDVAGPRLFVNHIKHEPRSMEFAVKHAAVSDSAVPDSAVSYSLGNPVFFGRRCLLNLAVLVRHSALALTQGLGLEGDTIAPHPSLLLGDLIVVRDSLVPAPDFLVSDFLVPDS